MQENLSETREAYTAGRLLTRYGPILATLVLGLGVWEVFYPALMSGDSVMQYQQALTHRFTSWHPPLMAIVLSGVLALGGGLGILMLAQCLAGVFGVRALAGAGLDALRGDRLSPAARAWIPVAVLTLLLLPVSPLAFYLMTFWKDAWEMVLLLWLGALSFRLVGSRGRPAAALISGVVLLGAFCGMARHNAMVALPFLGLFLGVELKRRGVRFAPAWVVAPLAAFLVLNTLLDRVFAVEDKSPEDWVLALDLAGVCARDAAACSTLPFTRSQIRDMDGLRARYRPGDLGSVFWEEPLLVDPGMVTLEHRPEIRAEYGRALRERPLLLAKLKVVAFWRMLGTKRTFYFFHGSLAENPYGLQLNERFRGLRESLTREEAEVAESRLRWISGAHIVWLLANGAWVLGLLAASWRRRDGRLLSLALLLMVPLGYSFSYLPATPVPDFRFLYPSTLWVQCVTVAAALGALGTGPLRQKPMGRAPNRASVSE
jgi:hypothetical protein